MEKKKTQQNYKGIDICKFIMSIFIVILHTHPFYNINDGLNFITADVLGRIAVPFFFAVTGFLLERKISMGEKDAAGVVRGYICRILKLYIIWTIVYLPIIIYTKVICSNEGIKHGIFTAVRDFIFCGSYAHLWYLPAVAVGVIIVFFLKKRMGGWKTVVFLIVLFAAGLLAQSYFGILLRLLEENGIIWNTLKIIKKIMVTSRNGIFFGSMFIYIGAATADRDSRMKPLTAWIGFLVSVLLLGWEEVWLHRMNFVREEDMYLMLIPAAFFLLKGSLHINSKGETIFLRRMSMNIYFIHMIFKFIYRQFIGGYNENGLLLFLFTLTGSLLFCFFQERIKKGKSWRRKKQ